MEFTHDATCPQGWAPGAFDFYELLPSFILRHADGACADAAFARGLGTFATPEQCAKACHATSGCVRFAFHHTAEELGAGGDDLPAGACTVAEAAVDGWYYPPADGRFDSAECKAHNAWREGWSEYSISRDPQGTTEFTVSVTPSLGDPDLYITSDGVLPSRNHYGWHAETFGEDAVTVDAHDPGWCSSCEYLVGVRAASTDAAYSVVAATAGGIVILEDGVEHQGQVEAGETQSFRLYVPGGGRTAGGKRALRPV